MLKKYLISWMLVAMTRSRPAKSHLHYIDNIRSVIIVFVVFFHGILSYTLICPWWYVIDDPPIHYSIVFILFLDIIMMPALFFISGLFAWPSYERKGAYHFMSAKFIFFHKLECFVFFWFKLFYVCVNYCLFYFNIKYCPYCNNKQ